MFYKSKGFYLQTLILGFFMLSISISGYAQDSTICGMNLTAGEIPAVPVMAEKDGVYKPAHNGPGEFFRVLFVFAQFKDDTRLYSGWPVNQLPVWANDIIDGNISTTYRDRTLSKYWQEMAGPLKKFDFIGNVYNQVVILPKTMAQYETDNKGYGLINKDVFNIIDADASFNFDYYDNWKFNTSTHKWEFAKDGTVDMIYVIYREAPKAGWFTDYYFGDPLAFDGIAKLGFDTDYQTNDVSSIGGYTKISGKTGVENGSGITIRSGVKENKEDLYKLLVHEFGHYVIGLGHTGLSNMIMDWENSQSATLQLSTLEREFLGYINYTNVTADNYSVALTDAITTGKILRIPIPVTNINSSNFFIVENHQRISDFDQIITGGVGNGGYDFTTTRGSGIYIYLVNEGDKFNPCNYKDTKIGGTKFVMRTADGSWNWTQDGYAIMDDGWPHFMPYFKRTSPNRDALSSDRFEWVADFKDPSSNNVSKRSMWHDLNPLTKEWELSLNALGDEKDAFTLTGNKLFSPWSNPSSYLDGNTGVSVELTGQTGSSITVNVRTT